MITLKITIINSTPMKIVFITIVLDKVTREEIKEFNIKWEIKEAKVYRGDSIIMQIRQETILKQMCSINKKGTINSSSIIRIIRTIMAKTKISLTMTDITIATNYREAMFKEEFKEIMLTELAVINNTKLKEDKMWIELVSNLKALVKIGIRELCTDTK